jgi:glucosamine-6-phosphate deaminase
MAWGSSKAAVIKKAVEDDDTEQVPASLLQNHDDVTFVVDESAASELTRNKSPWLT